jgi:hypothetical protein
MPSSGPCAQWPLSWVGHSRKFIKPCEKECRVFFIHLYVRFQRLRVLLSEGIFVWESPSSVILPSKSYISMCFSSSCIWIHYRSHMFEGDNWLNTRAISGRITTYKAKHTSQLDGSLKLYHIYHITTRKC